LIRTVWVLSTGLVLTVVLGSAVIVRSFLPGRGLPCVCERLTRFWSRAVLSLAGVRVRVSGSDRVDWTRPVVVVANHQSWFDVFALAAWLPGKGRFVAKQELGSIPIFGRAWKACGHISLDRSERARAIASLRSVAQRVQEENLAVILFPEGTRSTDGRMQPFKKGAFVLALDTGAPVVPIGITGSREVMPKGSFRIRSGEIDIRIGDPLSVEGLDAEARGALLAASEAAVGALLVGGIESGSRE